MNKYLSPVSLYMQSDYYEKWDLWLDEVRAFPKSITPISQKETSYGYTKDFYFTSGREAKIYACLYFNNSENAKHPLIILYHGLGAVMSTEGYKEIAGYWINEGYSVLGMDCRLQGGKSIDNSVYQQKEYGLTAYNVLNPDEYYSKYLFQDALQLLDIIDNFNEVKDRPIIITGGSKGGEQSLLAAAKSKRVSLCLCDIPSGCYLPGRIKGSHGGYAELNRMIKDFPHLEEQIIKTISYFDIIHLAREIKCPVLASVGSIDNVCPPHFFYQAYRQIDAPKEFVEYDGYGHGGYDKEHMLKKFEFIKKYEE